MVQKFILMLVAATFLMSAASALAVEPAGEDAIEFQTAKIFQEALKTNDKQTVAMLMRYPIGREYPLPAIKSPSDFISNWDDFFDASNIPAIIADEPDRVGWRGVMLGSGDVWFDGDRIIAINVRTKMFQKKFNEAKNRESLTIHPSARGYKSVALMCNTSTKSIRIQEHNDGIHYFVWKRGASLLEKPELDLKGTQEFEGSGGNSTYTFKNRNYSYALYVPVICGEPASCSDTLTVSKEGKELSSQICK